MNININIYAKRDNNKPLKIIDDSILNTHKFPSSINLDLDNIKNDDLVLYCENGCGISCMSEYWGDYIQLLKTELMDKLSTNFYIGLFNSKNYNLLKNKYLNVEKIHENIYKYNCFELQKVVSKFGSVA